MELRQDIVDKIKVDLNLRTKLALANNKHLSTIERWLANKDQKLTTATSLNVLREELQLDDEHLLTNTAA